MEKLVRENVEVDSNSEEANTEAEDIVQHFVLQLWEWFWQAC